MANCRVGTFGVSARFPGKRASRWECERMNLVDGLERIRTMLTANQADPATFGVVDMILDNAARMGANDNAKAQSLLQITKMLMRTPASNGNVRIYNDLARIEQQLTIRANELAKERADVVDRPVPKDKKFYKAQRDKEKAAKKSS